MALDPNLYTLDLVRRLNDSSICDWVESSTPNKVLYSRARATRSVEYASILYRTLFGPSHPLASITAPTPLAKKKTLQLHDPDDEVAFNKQGMTLASEWRFAWPVVTEGQETNVLCWKRDSVIGGSSAGKNSYTCWAIRTPDPNIPLAVYKPATGKDRKQMDYPYQYWDTTRHSSGKVEGHLQWNDPNINRLEVTDLRGLEFLLIMSLSTILDADYDDKHRTPVDNVYLSFTPAGTDAQSAKGKKRATASAKPASLNEVAVEEWGQASDYVQHCLWLLRDDGPHSPDQVSAAMQHGQDLAFIVLRAEGERYVPKAVQIAAEVKRTFYKLPQRKKGTEEYELFQYIKDQDDSGVVASTPSL